MRTNTLRTAAVVALALLSLLAAGRPAAADDVAQQGDQIFSGSIEAGYRATDTSDSQRFLFPYDRLHNGPVLGFDLLRLTPTFGTLTIDASFLDAEAWEAEAGYNYNAKVDVRAGSRSFTHERDHLAPLPVVTKSFETESFDANPGSVYRDELRDSQASIKVRAGTYPAHFRASGRIFTNTGDRQLRSFFRDCSTHFCHASSRDREVDQVTRQYDLGFDAHLGPADLVYSHKVMTFRDDAADPVDPVGNQMLGLPAGSYPHDVNPDLRSFQDSLRVNTNLANRVVLALSYDGGNQDNETSDITVRNRAAGANLSYQVSGRTFLVARYAYEEQRTEELGTGALALRQKNNAAHVSSGFNHQHVIQPEDTRNTAELSARFTPVSGAQVNARVRYRTRERYALIDLENGVWSDAPEKSRSTFAGVDGRYRLSQAVSVDASLGQEWTDDPAYAVENTSLTRYGAGATWTPGPILTLRAAWQGYRGKNDDQHALTDAYVDTAAPLPQLGREVRGDAWTVTAMLAPAKDLALTASWSLADSGVEQDLLLGSGDPGFTFIANGTPWSGRSQVADLRAVWTAAKNLTLTAEGLWVEGSESYKPTIAAGADLEAISRVEFSKLLATLQAELRLSASLGITLGGFWAKYNDDTDAAGDGTAEGLLAAVSYRW